MKDYETMIKIAPSILSADFSRLGEELKKVEDAGADLIHIDVMDGHFVPNITIGPLIVKAVKMSTKLPLDVHLMIDNPDRYIKSFAEAGADIITVHIEVCNHLQRTIQSIKDLNIKGGVVLNPATPLVTLEDILEEVDIVLLMSVNPGFEGQQFLSSVLHKIERLRREIDERNLKVEIEVDGGIKIDNAGDVIKAGGDIFVAGSAVFYSEDYRKTIERLRSASPL